MQNSNQQHKVFAWVLFAFVIIAPFTAWLSMNNWSLDAVSIVTVFPLLGIWAWSIMWTHYIVGGIRLLRDDQKYVQYNILTGYIVLALLLLHPTLLAWQQWQTIQVLPPMSFYDYVASSMKVFILFGSIALALFIGYDIAVRLKNTSFIRKNWHWVSTVQVVAMAFIFVHALAIGGLTDTSIFELYWVVLGAALLPFAGILVRDDWKNRRSSQ